MRTYKVVVSYNGLFFKGWAKQKNQITVQEEIEQKLSTLLNQKISIFGSGRTDKFVHAHAQVFHFKAKTKLSLSTIKKGFNSISSEYIYIKKINYASESFHARFDVKKKQYTYLVSDNEYNPILKDYIWFVDFKINLSLIKKASQLFIRKADFLSFSTSEVEDTIREISKISISRNKQGIVKIVIEGNGFLRSMVRMIVANLIFLSCNKTNVDWIKNKIDNPLKGSSIHKAPGGGLYLSKVFYKV